MKDRIVNKHGFTLIELMIVIAIVAILAAIAIPTYQSYTRRAYFSEVIQATAPYKLGVEQCYQRAGSPASVSGCGAGSGGVPAAITAGASGSSVGSVAVSSAGVITATASTNNGLAGETYILTPAVAAQTQGSGSSNILVWTQSGTCTALGYC